MRERESERVRERERERESHCPFSFKMHLGEKFTGIVFFFMLATFFPQQNSLTHQGNYKRQNYTSLLLFQVLFPRFKGEKTRSNFGHAFLIYE